MKNFQNSWTRLGCKLINHLGKREGGENMCHSGQLSKKPEELGAAVKKINYVVGCIKNRVGINIKLPHH